MKKRIIFILMFTMLAVGCSDTKDLQARIVELENENAELKSKLEDTNDLEVVEKKEEGKEKESKIKDINIGDVITTDRKEITINNIELSYDVLPKDTSSFYTHYPADSGKVYIHVDTDVKNTQKQNLACDEIMTVEAEYNNGFTYSSITIPEDSSGFTYANITSIIPLETMGVRFLIDCPQEVEETDNPLYLVFKVDENEYKYTIR